MSKLKLGPITDEKPVRLTAELPAEVHRDLVAYANVLGQQTGRTYELGQLVAPMLKHFMATGRVFARARRSSQQTSKEATASAACALAQDSEIA